MRDVHAAAARGDPRVGRRRRSQLASTPRGDRRSRAPMSARRRGHRAAHARTASCMPACAAARAWPRGASMWQCTLPSESRPRKCSRAAACAARATICFHVSPSNIAPRVDRAADELARPARRSWPAPSALWPTSLLPMSSSDGRPTALPWAHSSRRIAGTHNRSSVGVAAIVTASASSPAPRPIPSMHDEHDRAARAE